MLLSRPAEAINVVFYHHFLVGLVILEKQSDKIKKITHPNAFA
jgi:hypothetical protein